MDNNNKQQRRCHDVKMVDHLSLSLKGKNALKLSEASGEYVDPAASTHKQLLEAIERKQYLKPPPPATGSIFASLSPEQFTHLAYQIRGERQCVERLRYEDMHTTTAMISAAAALAAAAHAQGSEAHPGKPTSFGVTNFQQASGFLAMFTAPNGDARTQLLNMAGGASPELILEVLKDPQYFAMFLTFQHAALDGTSPMAENTKKCMQEHASPGTLLVESCEGSPNDQVPKINKFCEKGTGGKIPQIVDELDPDCVAVLLCCVFLKVKWRKVGKRCSPDLFYEHPGIKEDGESFADLAAILANTPPLLEQQRYFRYANTSFPSWTDEHTGVLWLKLDCEPEPDGSERFMLFALPPREVLDYKESLFKSMRGLAMHKFVSVKFDKVRLPCVSVPTNALDGKALLKSLGVRDIFERGDALPMLFPKDVAVSRVIHGSGLEWNDEGAQAYAATIVECAYRSLNAEPPGAEFVMNRPGLALLCKAIPEEEAHHVAAEQPRAAMVCEFFTLVEGHASADTPGSMGDFAKDGAAGAADDADDGGRALVNAGYRVFLG